jgi:hypothetical protein
MSELVNGWYRTYHVQYQLNLFFAICLADRNWQVACINSFVCLIVLINSEFVFPLFVCFLYVFVYAIVFSLFVCLFVFHFISLFIRKSPSVVLSFFDFRVQQLNYILSVQDIVANLSAKMNDIISWYQSLAVNHAVGMTCWGLIKCH